MSIKLTILGSGPAIAIPRPGHTDKTCREARKPGSRSRRMRSSILIENRCRYLLIDAGPDILEQLELAKIRRPDAVFLTHAHSDAAGGVDDLALFLRGTKTKPMPLYAEASVLRRITKISALFHARPKTILKTVNPKIIHLYQAVSSFGLKIIPLKVEHALTPGFPTVGYLFPKKFAYLSDFASIPPRSLKLLKKINILFLDAAMWFGTKMAAHQNTAQAIEIGRQLGVKKLYLTQIGHNYPPHKIAQKEISNYCRKNKIKFPVILAYDGLKIKI
ncbi:MBL fold metallo-hydrolase [Candidatus Falkowbacteria bacterium]|nr:MBL fold metallo-hydrolase [Candidatus Falkowbacteria bacterium]